MYKELIIVLSLLIMCENSFAMEDQNTSKNNFNQVIVNKVIPDHLVQKIDGKILTTFKKNLAIVSFTKNNIRKEMLNACQNALYYLKDIIAIGCTNKFLHRQAHSYITQQEKYIFDTLHYVDIKMEIEDISECMTNCCTGAMWRAALSQLKLYTQYKDIVLFWSYCETKKKLNDPYYDPSQLIHSNAEKLVFALLTHFCDEQVPQYTCLFCTNERLSKIFYRSLCTEKKLLLKEVIQNITNSILLKQLVIKVLSTEPYDQVSLKDLIITQDNTRIAYNPHFKLYVISKKSA